MTGRWSLGRVNITAFACRPPLSLPRLATSYAQSFVSKGVDTPRRRLPSFSRRDSTSAPDVHHVETPASSTSRVHVVRLRPSTQGKLAEVDLDHGHLRRRSSGGQTKANALRMSLHCTRSTVTWRSSSHTPFSATTLQPRHVFDLPASYIGFRWCPAGGS